ncbi:MAG TPA: FHA domain-containing protein [Tepidiformaceae bacterium]|nr:FHA domain-containing protein [Tepidiformaceae bacterium]
MREYPLDVTQVFIGRAEGNRVVIDHVSVSRRHARLDFVNGQVLLQDLQSATGTYVSGQRLAPEAPRAISVGEALRFGECQATLVAAAGPDAGGAGGGGASAATRVEQAIAVSVTSPGAPVAPGSAATATVSVQNRGNVADTVQVAIHGLPDSWVRITRPSVQLLPDARDEVVVIIQPPREPSSLAGQHDFAAAATSLQHNVEVRALGRLMVLPAGDLSLEIRPAQSRKLFSAIVENQSNSPARVVMNATDPGDELAVSFQPSELELEPGQSGTVEVDARLRTAGFFGSESHHAFKTEAKADTRLATANAELRYRPPWLLWRWVALAVLVVAVGIGGWFAYSALAGDGNNQAGDPDETATVTSTRASDETPSPPPTKATTGPQTAGLQVGSTAVVTNSPEGDCLLVRPFHTRQSGDPRSQPIDRICDGARVTIIGARVEDEGYYWYAIRTDKGVEGWSAEGLVSGGPRFLTAAQ